MTMTNLKERPILFSGAMVRAILAGEKTQTRRVVKPQFGPEAMPAEMCAETAEGWQTSGHSGRWWDDCNGDADAAVYCPYGKPGDRLWVRETFNCMYTNEEMKTIKVADLNDGDLVYRADGEYDYGVFGPWQPSIFMPRWASRITLEITDVRVERLQDISEADAWAEGCLGTDDDVTGGISGYREYYKLWESINGKTAPWASNPWVWVLTFKRA